jgi:hypothetical protein
MWHDRALFHRPRVVTQLQVPLLCAPDQACLNIVPPAELSPSLFEWCQIQTCPWLAGPFHDHTNGHGEKENKNNQNIILNIKYKHCSLLAMTSSNTPTITRVPQGTIIDEIVANSRRSSFDLTLLFSMMMNRLMIDRFHKGAKRISSKQVHDSNFTAPESSDFLDGPGQIDILRAGYCPIGQHARKRAW